MKIKHIVCLSILALGISNIALADDIEFRGPPPINKVTYDLSVKKWVVAKDAKVHVQVNAALTNAQLATFQQSVQSNLKKVAAQKKGDWKIIEFTQHKAPSGLENIYMVAQKRLDSKAISGLRDQLKKFDQKGVQYKLGQVSYTPSFAQLQKTKSELRQKLYAKISSELKGLNSTVKGQTFQVHEISILDQQMPKPQLNMLYTAKSTRAMDTAVAERAPMTVSQRVILSARVTFAELM